MSHCQTPKNLNDNFLFHYEFRITAFIWFMAFVSYIASAVLLFADFVMLSYTVTAAISICCQLPSLLSTLWIPKKIQIGKLWQDPDRYGSMYSRSPSISVSTARDQNGTTPSMRRRLMETLLNEDEFEGLMDWIHREFSSETILGFIEFNQYKEYVSSYS